MLSIWDCIAECNWLELKATSSSICLVILYQYGISEAGSSNTESACINVQGNSRDDENIIKEINIQIITEYMSDAWEKIKIIAIVLQDMQFQLKRNLVFFFFFFFVFPSPSIEIYKSRLRSNYRVAK